MVLIIATIGILSNQNTQPVIPTPSLPSPTPTPTPTPTPVIHSRPVPSPFGPAPVLGKVLDDYPIVEAIDLPNQPTLGPAWDVTDGNLVDEDLRGDYFVTPCGVFVTVLTAKSSVAKVGATPRIMGYDIASGTQLWSHTLADVTGQANLVPGSVEPSYTTDCKMVISMYASTGQNVALVVDLATGDSQTVHAGELRGCVAAGEGWVGCWTGYPDEKMIAVNLNDPDAGWERDADTSYIALFGAGGDGVIAGNIWTTEGYRDPATSTVTFGADAKVGSTILAQTSEPWVVYAELYRPGGYRSGLAVRMEGLLAASLADMETCTIMAWDPAADAAMWPNPGSLPCGDGYNYSWAVAGQALIVTYNVPALDNALTRAYALATGDLLWEEKGYLDGTSWNYAHRGQPAGGISENYVLCLGTEEDGYTQHIIRIADGAELVSPQYGAKVLATTMAYRTFPLAHQQPYSLIAYVIDPYTPGVYPPEAWVLPIGTGLQSVWTFTIDQQMYIVYGPSAGPDAGKMSVSPLVT